MSPFPSLFGDGLPKYKYSPIPPGARTFRLAKLLPPEPSLIRGLEPTIRISLVECEAGRGRGGGASVEYDALSYAWDVPPNVKRPNRRIIVESGRERAHLNIYRPLELALLRFAAANADAGGAKYDRPLFIDQICINQDDDDEKALQVPLMQAIYAQSRRAVIWLGPGTASSDAWYAYVRDLCADGTLGGLMGPRVASIMRIYDAVLSHPAVVLADPTERQDRDDLLSLTERCAGRYPIAAYLALLRRTWFGRLWTIQEACLAPAVVVVCGDALLCFDCFRAGMFFYNIQNGWWLRHITTPQSVEEMRMRNAVFDATLGFSRIYQERKAIHHQQRGGGGGHRAPLHELVIKHSLVSDGSKWKVGASLGQDRIYGLLGLAAADDPVKAQLGIYYDKDNQAAAQVKAYVEAAGLFLEQGHMDVLLFNQFPKKTQGLPSWAPDWAMDHLVMPVSWTALHQPAFAAGGGGESPYASCAKADATGAAGRISVKGVLIGHVAAVGQATYKAQTRVQQITQQIEYSDAKLMFDEVDRFVHAALTQNDAMEQPSPETLAHTRLRVCDSGLSSRQFAAQFAPSADAGTARLLELQSCIAGLGERILRAAANARAYSLFNIYATVGVTPWYLDYYRATTTLYHLARGPIPLARTMVLALADAVDDVVALCVASTRVWLATVRIALRRRSGKVMIAVSDENVQGTGMDPTVVKGEDMTAFLNNLERNIGRRVFRTEEGHVGMGPGEMETGDAVVVLHGLSTPMVLRPADGGREEWMVVGEAYCDGVMDGEALGVNERQFVLL